MKHEGCTRGFTHLSKAWYGEANLRGYDIIDQLMIGFYDIEEGGTTGEFSITWKMLGGRSVPYLKAYEDSWDALYHFQDVLTKMRDADGQNISPDDMSILLVSCGVKDLTKTDSPYDTPLLAPKAERK